MTMLKEREIDLPPFQSRLEKWDEDTLDFIRSAQEEKSKVEELLNEGYLIFFDIIEPHIETANLTSEDPIHAKGFDFSFQDERLKGFDRELLGKDKFGGTVTIFGYQKGGFGDEPEATVLLQDGYNVFSKKSVTISYNRQTSTGLKGYMRIEETSDAWIRPLTGGKLDKTETKSLTELPALQILRLVNSLAHIYVEKLDQNS
jgi:hypothetical protein